MVLAIWKASTLILFLGSDYVYGWVRGVALNGGDFFLNLSNETTKSAAHDVRQSRLSDLLHGASTGMSASEQLSDGKGLLGSKLALSSGTSETVLRDVNELRLWHFSHGGSKDMFPLFLLLALFVALVGVGIFLTIPVRQSLVRESVAFSMKVRNVQYDLLSANVTLVRQFNAALQNAIIEQVVAPITTEHIQITLSRGSVEVHVTVRPPQGVTAVSLQSQLAPETTCATVLKHLNAVSGINDVTTGDIDCSWISSPTVRSSMFTDRHEAAASSNQQSSNPLIADEEHKVGDHIATLNGEEFHGIIRYVGSTDFADGIWIGIELSEPCGKNDGSVNGKRYFQCAPNHGVFVRKQFVTTSRGWNTVRSVVKTIGAFKAAARNK